MKKRVIRPTKLAELIVVNGRVPPLPVNTDSPPAAAGHITVDVSAGDAEEIRQRISRVRGALVSDSVASPIRNDGDGYSAVTTPHTRSASDYAVPSVTEVREITDASAAIQTLFSELRSRGLTIYNWTQINQLSYQLIIGSSSDWLARDAAVSIWCRTWRIRLITERLIRDNPESIDAFYGMIRRLITTWSNPIPVGIEVGHVRHPYLD